MVPKILTNPTLESSLMGGSIQHTTGSPIMGAGMIPSTGYFHPPQPITSALPGTQWPIDATPNPYATKKYFKLSKFEEAKKNLRSKASLGARQGIDWYYEHQTCEDVIAALGWWNPTFGGRPKRFAQILLDGIPSPVAGKGMHWKGIGLMYFTPPVVGRSRSKNRTSVAGLALLKHWASQYPGFRKFFDAYYDPKCETEITLDCIDLALGSFPSRFKQIVDSNVGRIEKAKSKEMEHYAAAMALARKAQARQAQTTGLYSGYAAQASALVGTGGMVTMQAAPQSRNIMPGGQDFAAQMQAKQSAAMAQQANLMAQKLFK